MWTMLKAISLKAIFLLYFTNIAFCVVIDYEEIYEEVSTVEYMELILTEECDPGEPLFLTKYIEDGQLEEGRQAASVEPFFENVISYSGYLTVNKEYNSNMFFWYFQSERDYENAPTVVWLQGGPGTSMFLGLFDENGPYKIDENQLLKRKYRWSKISNIIYFDSPVGTGYSFTENESGYAKNQTDVANDLYEALVQLYKLFPYLQKNDLFLTGESYAGKYVPAFGYTIHENNQNKPEVFLNLTGMMVGNPFVDPINMLNYSDYLYQLGFIDDNQKVEFKKVESKIGNFINRQELTSAAVTMDDILGDSSLFSNYTGLPSVYNYLAVISVDFTTHNNYIITSSFLRSRVHVGYQMFYNGSLVADYLQEDEAKSAIGWVVELLQYYRILFYNGQLDIICAYPLMENALKNMEWPLSNEYKLAKRNIYKVDNLVAGYYKSVGNLTEVLIRNAGHMVPLDQPVWAYQLFYDFLMDNLSAEISS